MLQTATPRSGVLTYARDDLTWLETEKAGMRLAPVRASRETGQYLGYLLFERFAETGVHQHLGPAFSYFLRGGLTDFQGTAAAGEMGINLEGATHTAISYGETLAASRLEAPVIYPSEDAVKGEVLHTGATPGEIENLAPEILPDMNVPLEALPWAPLRWPGVQRRMVFDYRETAHDRRNVQLRLLPGTTTPPFETTAPIDVYVIGGDLSAVGETVGSGGFMVIEEGARLQLSTRYGASIIAWAEGPTRPDEGLPCLMGFEPRRSGRAAG
jgi:hypothetical protein